MANGLKSLTLFTVLILLLSCIFFPNEARLFKPVQQQNMIDREIMKILDDLYVEAMKNGGPSHGGDGHAATDALTLGGIKKSGPSPGDGH
ncbi:hypothetical protein BUALT_Bualt08G0037900 [Buddleja alternifolia]|uniref:Transmembrane protein n=1 Tax=Buddleja alternifolia TaxID=168488 RepID=A0AAV6X2U4_9LAMI|nr:hypothetical protein BUALT_Bualt08G0037900 [Buddleja alternifolia]